MATEVLGTCYFPSFEYACRYYAGQLCDKATVKQKIDEGQIRVGQPPPKPGWVSYLDPNEGRWFRKQKTHST